MIIGFLTSHYDRLSELNCYATFFDEGAECSRINDQKGKKKNSIKITKLTLHCSGLNTSSYDFHSTVFSTMQDEQVSPFHSESFHSSFSCQIQWLFIRHVRLLGLEVHDSSTYNLGKVSTSKFKQMIAVQCKNSKFCGLNRCNHSSTHGLPQVIFCNSFYIKSFE